MMRIIAYRFHSRFLYGCRNYCSGALVKSGLSNLKTRPNITDFNHLFTAMSKITPDPPLSTVVTLYNELELSGLRPDKDSISILVNCYCGLGRPDFAFSVMGKRIKLGYPPDITIVNTLLNGLIVSDKLEAAFKLLDKIVKLEIQPIPVTYYEMCEGFVALETLLLLSSCFGIWNVKVLVSILIASMTLLLTDFKDQLLPQALRLFEEMKTKGISANLGTYNTLIRELCRLEQWDEAKDLLTDNNIDPDYHTLIDLHCQDGTVDEASDIFEVMTKTGVPADVDTYTVLFNAYCCCGEMVEAEKLLDVMVQDGFIPDDMTFYTLISGYCTSEKVDKALEMFQDMHLKGTPITVDGFMYSALIQALCSDNKLQIAFELFKDMQDRGVAPCVFIYNSLLRGLFQNAQIERVVSLRREMEYNNGVAANLCTYDIILDGLCEAGRLPEAIEEFSFLVAKGLRPNVYIYNIMIKELCKKGRLSDATELIKEMEDNRCSPNACTYNTIIKGFLNANDVGKALEILRKMRCQGFDADADCATLFVSLLSARKGIA